MGTFLALIVTGFTYTYTFTNIIYVYIHTPTYINTQTIFAITCLLCVVIHHSKVRYVVSQMFLHGINVLPGAPATPQSLRWSLAMAFASHDIFVRVCV